MTYSERIIDVQTGQETIRPYTEEEIAAQERREAELLLDIETIREGEAAKQTEKERIAAALGLTLDELKVLLG